MRRETSLEGLLIWFCRRAIYLVFEGWWLFSRWIACPIRELTAHEVKGHTIGRHIAVSPQVLAERAATEGRQAVSSFWNLAIARAAINYAVVLEFDTVANWFLTGESRRLPLTVMTPSFTSIGYGLTEDDRRLRYSKEITVVLERSGPTFYILTAFPRL